jgi:hypothetical protein
VQYSRVWALGVDRRDVIEGVSYDDELDEITVRCRLRRGGKRRCGRCGERSSLYGCPHRQMNIPHDARPALDGNPSPNR